MLAKILRVSGSFLALCIAAAVTGCSRPAQTAAAPPPPAPIEYVDAWGTHGDGPGQLTAPVAMTGDGESNIYIVDAASGYIHKFSTSGEPRLSFQDDRANLHPVDVAVDAGGAIYVADAHRGTVVIYFSDGMHHRELRVGSLPAARESLRIGVDAYGTIFATAKRPFGVRKFNTALRLAGSWGGAAAQGAAIDNPSALAVGPDGLVYIHDSGRSQIGVYDATGTLQRALSVPAQTGEAALDGIAIDAKYVFAVDTRRPTVYIWTLDGTYRLGEDLSAWIPGGSVTPRKLVVTPAGELLVLDVAASRVFRFRLHL
jgi:sugar lactone lactonase YvrE